MINIQQLSNSNSNTLEQGRVRQEIVLPHLWLGWHTHSSPPICSIPIAVFLYYNNVLDYTCTKQIVPLSVPLIILCDPWKAKINRQKWQCLTDRGQCWAWSPKTARVQGAHCYILLSCTNLYVFWENGNYL